LLAAAGGGIIEAFPAIPQELPLDAWDERERQRVVQPMLEALSHRHRLQIATTRIISPRDFRDKLHLFQGAVYGLSPTADPRAPFPHRTPVPGLYQAGQTTYPGLDVASAAMSGILAVDALLRRERLD
jgi:phytoene desaturase